MRFLHVITDFTSPYGAETALARLLRHGGVEGDVVSLRGISAANRRAAGPCPRRYHALGARGPCGFMRAVGALAALLRRDRPDRVVCWMYHAMVAGALATRMAGTGAPVFWMVRQSLDDPAALTRSTRAALAAARQLSPSATGICYNAHRARALHRAYGFSDRNDAVVANGFDLPSQPEVGSTARVFGVASRYHPQKDYPTLLAAAAHACAARPDIRFVMSGDGAEAGNPSFVDCLRRSGAPRDRISLLGECADMGPFYRGIDALVLSSRTEGCPNVVGEAMSYAKPVVTTDVGDAARIVGATGLVAPPRDPHALARAIVAMRDLDPEAYAERARAARLRIEEIGTVPAMVAHLSDFMRV